MLPGYGAWPSVAEGLPPPRIDVYWGTPLGEFLTVLFSRLVVTSTQVELQLSRYSGLTDTRSKRLGLAGFAAKAMNQTLKQAVDRWRADVVTGQTRQPTLRARQVWTKAFDKGGKIIALHLYTSYIHAKMKG